MATDSTVMAFTVVAPDYLLPELAALLDSDPSVSEALRSGALSLSTDLKVTRLEDTIVIVPEMPRFIEWICCEGDTLTQTLSMTSHQLAHIAQAAERAVATVFKEQDLLEHPQFVLRKIAEKIGLRQPTGEDMVTPPPSEAAVETAFPDPLYIYDKLPVSAGTFAWWPYSIFLTSEGVCPPVIDIMGKARVLLCGPHIALSDGRWRADIAFDLTKEAVAYDYLIQFGTTGRFSRAFFRSKTAGQQMVCLEFDAKDNAPAEIRIELLRAGFHGQFRFLGCWVRKLN